MEIKTISKAKHLEQNKVSFPSPRIFFDFPEKCNIPEKREYEMVQLVNCLETICYKIILKTIAKNYWHYTFV